MNAGKLCLLSALAVATLALAGCGGGGGPSAPVTEKKASVVLSIAMPTRSAETRGIADVTKFQVIVTGPEGQLNNETTDYAGGDTINLQVWVPVGLNRVFTVNALRANGAIEFTGKSAATNVTATGGAISIILQAPGQDTTIDIVIHEINGPPAITFTHVPDYGTWGDPLKGSVQNVLPGTAKVMVFIKVRGGWWVKPYFDTPFSPIDSAMNWVCSITTGGVDQEATEIRAYLLDINYPYSTAMPVDPDADANDMVWAMASVTRSP